VVPPSEQERNTVERRINEMDQGRLRFGMVGSALEVPAGVLEIVGGGERTTTQSEGVRGRGSVCRAGGPLPILRAQRGGAEQEIHAL